MITIADLKQHLEQFDDDAMIVFTGLRPNEVYRAALELRDATA